MSDFIVGMEEAVKRLRENEDANVRLLKSLHAEIAEMNQEARSEKITIVRYARETLILKVDKFPEITISIDQEGQKFTLQRGSDNHPRLSFIGMQKILQEQLATDLFYVEKRTFVCG